jgi:hypothetical protein
MTVKNADVSKKNLPCTFHSLKIPLVFAEVVQQFTGGGTLFSNRRAFGGRSFFERGHVKCHPTPRGWFLIA